MDQSDDSVEEPSTGSQEVHNRFRIRVCASEVVSGERSRLYVSVSGARRVRWLQRRVQRLLGLQSGLRLLVSGHWLPPDEPLAPLLRPDDLVDVIATNEENSECNDISQAQCKTIDLHDELHEYKKRALLMLERLSPTPGTTCAGGDGALESRPAGDEADGATRAGQRPRRRRLRCRRRRARTPDQPVLRNDHSSIRDARLVRALDISSSFC